MRVLVCLVLFMALAVMVVSSPVKAQDAAKDVIVKKDGTRYTGTLLEDSGQAVKFRNTGGETLTVPYSMLDSRTVLMLRGRRTSPQNAPAQQDLGDWALAQGLHHEARHHYCNAMKADANLQTSSLVGIHRANTLEATHLMGQAEKAQARHDVKQEVKLLSRLICEFPHSEEAIRAQKMMEKCEIQRNMQNRCRKLDSTTRNEIRELEHAYDMAVKHEKRGYAVLLKQSRAEREFKTALHYLRRAQVELKRVHSRQGHYPELAEHVSAWEKEIQDLAVRVYLDLARLDTLRQSFHNALEWIHKAELVEPDNPEVKAAMGRTELTMNVHSTRYRW
jgi:hypothetical protein